MSGARNQRPRERPVPVILVAVVAALLLLALILWLLLPDGPVTVVVVAVVVLGAVGTGLWSVLSLPQLSREPERRPTRPPDDL